MDTEKRLVVANRGRVGGGLGLADVSYYIYIE